MGEMRGGSKLEKRASMRGEQSGCGASLLDFTKKKKNDGLREDTKSVRWEMGERVQHWGDKAKLTLKCLK